MGSLFFRHLLVPAVTYHLLAQFLIEMKLYQNIIKVIKKQSNVTSCTFCNSKKIAKIPTNLQKIVF